MQKAVENSDAKELQKEILRLKARNQNLEAENQNLEAEKNCLQFRIDQLNRLLFGAKSERYIPKQGDVAQMELPFDGAEETPEETVQREEISYTRQKKTRENYAGRNPLPDHLPVEEIVPEPEEDTTGLRCIGKEITDKPEVVPARFFIKRYIRPRYIKPEDDENLQSKGVIAELPSFPIEKGIAGASLHAQITIDKFMDHLPIHRQIQRFKRENVHIPASNWQLA